MKLNTVIVDTYKISVYTRKDSKYWCFSYYIDGKRKQRVTPYKSKESYRVEAMAWAVDYVSVKLNDKRTMTFRELYEQMFSEKSEWLKYREAISKPLSGGRLLCVKLNLKNHVIPVIGDQKIASIRRPDIDKLLLANECSNGTKNIIANGIRMVFSEAERLEIIETQPKVMSFGVTPKQKKIFTSNDLAKLFPAEPEEMARVWNMPEMMLFYQILANTGIRFGECLALNIDDVSPSGFLYITKNRWKMEIGPVKSRESRVVLIPDEIVKSIIAFVMQRDKELRGQYIFPKVDISYRWALKCALKHTGLSGFTPHSFRHTYNTMLSKLAAVGKMPKEAQMLLLGHKSYKISQHYDHLNDDREQLGNLAKTLLVYRDTITKDGLSKKQFVEPDGIIVDEA